MQKWKVGDDAVVWTAPDGDWVPAEVDQKLYDTLERVLNSGTWFGSALEFNSYEGLLGDQLEQVVRDALATADGEDV